MALRDIRAEREEPESPGRGAAQKSGGDPFRDGEAGRRDERRVEDN
ncbi:MAG: hypothetical protein XD88_1472 [Methanocalculus sp. 52_23]|nr:MAG: hypothetical protein XD88_1472 [Methanocalculus sp. 52_23]